MQLYYPKFLKQFSFHKKYCLEILINVCIMTRSDGIRIFMIFENKYMYIHLIKISQFHCPREG